MIDVGAEEEKAEFDYSFGKYFNIQIEAVFL
jgi:hypothetical protein